jgi:hypothetical protein
MQTGFMSTMGTCVAGAAKFGEEWLKAKALLMMSSFLLYPDCHFVLIGGVYSQEQDFSLRLSQTPRCFREQGAM